MELTGKQVTVIGIITGIALVGAYAFGRHSAPEKVRIETQTVTVTKEVEKKKQDAQVDTKKDKNTKTIITETEFPDGRKEKRTEIVEDTSTDQTKKTKTDITKTDDTSTKTTETTTIEKSHSRLNISALAGKDFSQGITALGNQTYGASISRNLIGPVTLGVWGLSCGIGGVSVGLDF